MEPVSDWFDYDMWCHHDKVPFKNYGVQIIVHILLHINGLVQDCSLALNHRYMERELVHHSVLPKRLEVITESIFLE